MPPDIEHPLDGGGLTPVVRVGDTVRRATGPWTPAVHALLHHLGAVGFAGSPRVHGLDDSGREVLDHVDGELPTGYDDSELVSIAGLLRGLHDATAGFQGPPGSSWQRMVGAPLDGPVVCHNDVAPSNIVLTVAGPVLLDWDLAAPGPGLWDLAWAAYRCVPLYDEATCRALGITVRPAGPRLRLFCDAYGLDVTDRSRLLDTVEARLECLVATARAWGTEGRPGWVDVWRDTRGRQWLAGLTQVRDQRQAWEPHLS